MKTRVGLYTRLRRAHPLVAVLCTGSVLFFSFLSLPWNVRLGHSHFDSPDSVTPAAWHEFRKQCEWFKNNENDGSLPETLNETVTTDTLPPPSSISDEILNIAVTVFPVCVCVCLSVFEREREWESENLPIVCKTLWRRSIGMGERVDLGAWTGDCGSSIACR